MTVEKRFFLSPSLLSPFPSPYLFSFSQPHYYDTPISEFMKDDVSVGEVIAALWFKRKLPKYATKFIGPFYRCLFIFILDYLSYFFFFFLTEIVLVLAADHGPCVSGGLEGKGKNTKQKNKKTRKKTFLNTATHHPHNHPPTTTTSP